MRLALPILLLLPAAALADAEAGRMLARQCSACHGNDGHARMPGVPNLGGQPEEYLVKQLEEFRAGIRSDPQMTLIAERLSYEDIAALAAWFASIEVTFTVPE